MKVIVMALVAASMLSGCAIPDRIKNVRKCTLGVAHLKLYRKITERLQKEVRTNL